MDKAPKIVFWTIAGIIGFTISLYLSSVLYFLLNGWNPDLALPWSIFSYLSYTQSPYGRYLAISLIAPPALIAVIIALFIFKPENPDSRNLIFFYQKADRVLG